MPDPAPGGMVSGRRHRAFRWIWAGAMVSNIGNWMEAVAQSWLVQQQTASPFFVELLAASEFIPHALLMLAAGWIADHYDRRKLLLAGQSTMMALGLVLAVAAHRGLATPWVIIALAFGVEFRNQDASDMMLLVRLVHDVVLQLFSDSGIEDFFFNRGMDLELSQRLSNDLFFFGACIGFLKAVKQVLHLVMILDQDGGWAGVHGESSARSSVFSSLVQ